MLPWPQRKHIGPARLPWSRTRKRPLAATQSNHGIDPRGRKYALGLDPSRSAHPRRRALFVSLLGQTNRVATQTRVLQRCNEHRELAATALDQEQIRQRLRIRSLETPLEDFLPENHSFLSICSSPDYKSIHTFISSGQFFIRCDEIGIFFIDQI